ncbi:MAG: hypothetical protein KDD50_16670 [Bdellovibrionales bacterium]|nr:hypothetical protein [Bdellovibrionales bacterium]
MKKKLILIFALLASGITFLSLGIYQDNKFFIVAAVLALVAAILLFFNNGKKKKKGEHHPRIGMSNYRDC